MSDAALPGARPRVAFPPNWPARIGWIVLIAYVAYASTILDVTWDRFVAASARARTCWRGCFRRTSPPTRWRCSTSA